MDKSASVKTASSVRVPNPCTKKKQDYVQAGKNSQHEEGNRTESPTVNQLFDLPIRAELATATP